ncbi:MAG: class I SAM-dependent methyltransferase [Myxococcota bacterium]
MTPAELGSRLESRHFKTLTFPEVRRALQAVSEIYVQKRKRLGKGAVFDGAGKRAAFALFYGPLHYGLTLNVLRELGADAKPRRAVLDLGCGTGVVGGAWACHAGAEQITGIDVEGWALKEAAWTYRQLGRAGRTRRGDASKVSLNGYDAVCAGFFVNELSDAARDVLLKRLIDASAQGTEVLVLEPISKRIVPWWPEWAQAFISAGGRADEWRFRDPLPDIVSRLDRAARLDHREQKARSLFISS